MTNKEKAALYPISFELGGLAELNRISEDLKLANMVNGMAEFYLKEMEGKELNDKHIRFKSFIDNVQAMCIKSKQIINWNIEKMTEESNKDDYIKHLLHKADVQDRLIDRLKEEVE